MDSTRYMVFLSSMTISLGLYLQAYKVWRSKSAKDFSSVLLGSLLFNEVVWLKYGIGLGEWPIVLVSSVNLPAVVIIIFLYFKYGRGRESNG